MRLADLGKDANLESGCDTGAGRFSGTVAPVNEDGDHVVEATIMVSTGSERF